MAHSYDSSVAFVESRKDSSDIARGDGFVVGAVSYSDGSNSARISLTGLGEWIDVPTEMIESAKVVGTASSKEEKFPISLIKFREPSDPLGQLAYKLLAQLGSVQKSREGSTKEELQKIAASRSRSGFAGISGGNNLIDVRFECYPCELCIPFTNICWQDTCCEIKEIIISI